MPSKEGSSVSASDCGVCCAKIRGATHIDSNKINNERIFIPDLYPQISQISADFICDDLHRHPQLGSRSGTNVERSRASAGEAGFPLNLRKSAQSVDTDG